MGFKWHRGPSAATLVDDLLRALAYAEARAADTLPELSAHVSASEAAATPVPVAHAPQRSGRPRREARSSR